ncbi:MAG: hypothetical protein HQ510_07720 [Candidatus Marinimicrobia bacterium]|nr:hypothetical protein [Candidatus Neomarinimicrobiota bacterium]
MKIINILFAVIAFTFLLAQDDNIGHIPSTERGDSNYRRATNEDVNKVRTTILNYGIAGRAGSGLGHVPFEWPVNSQKHYIAMTALSVGTEVLTEEGINRPLVTITFRADQAGNTKAWEPVPGYLNANSLKIAISDDYDTWPLTWPDKMDDETDPGWQGSWNGYFGKDQFSAEQEIYYKVSDDRNFNEGYTYYPDSTDYSRKGAGLLTGIRVMEWKQILIEDVVFILHEIKNDGTKPLEKVAFSLWLADMVGGDGDTMDDTPDFDLMQDVAWSMDNDGIGNSAFGTDPVGVAATSFIETPGNNVDRIDNDGDGETNGPDITDYIAPYSSLIDENYKIYYGDKLGNAIDDNHNGLIDENPTHVAFGDQFGVTMADHIDNNSDGEEDSPVVTAEMVAAAATDEFCDDENGNCYDQWFRWPPNPEEDDVQNGQIHLLSVEASDIGLAYADGIDNNADPVSPYALEYPFGMGAEVDSPVITQEMVDEATNDPFHRYRVMQDTVWTGIILYDVGIEDLGKPYADGIDNDNDKATDEGIDEGIDEMIDESRDDGIDNDGDWMSVDDVGIYGDGSGGLASGAGDGKPSSGTGTAGFPGEPNIDKTDVSESDQMGLTTVGYDPAGSIPVNNSNQLWHFYLSPGLFWQPPEGGQPPGDYDLFVTSSFFPLEAGQTERIAMAVALGNNQTDAIRNRNVAQTTYDFDYQFAKSPNAPIVSALSGDGRVTLYWDSEAEDSEDNYMYKITNGAIQYDFEGYKIYRATDFEFADAYRITDGEGNPTFLAPYNQNGQKAQWDLIDDIKGFHPVDLNGIKFYLGDDTGLQHTYVDSNVVNGQRYYYAVVAYDYGGDESNNILPSDSPMRLRVNSLTGVIELGPNVVEITPVQAAAGYQQAPSEIEIDHVQGTSSGKVFYTVVNPMEVNEYHRYQITFTQDTLENNQGLSGYDTLTTKHWFLADISEPGFPDTLVKPEFEYFLRDTVIVGPNGPITVNILDSLYTNPLPEHNDFRIIDGFKLQFENVQQLTFNPQESFWTNDSLVPFDVRRFYFDAFYGTPMPANYRVIFTDNYDQDTHCYCANYIISDPCLPGGNSIYCTTTYFGSEPIYFYAQKRVGFNNTESDWEDIPFLFGDFIPDEGDGIFNKSTTDGDWIVFMDAINSQGDPAPSWFFQLINTPEGDTQHIQTVPNAGDTAFVSITKPFLANDVYEFTSIPSLIDQNQAREDMKKIKVVPNPYFGAVSWEGLNTYSSGRGPREIQFRYLPADCTIRIYTISGELVKKLDHHEAINNGMEPWDMLTKDNLSASYGVYIYHVDAPGIGTHIGKFAIVK